MHSETFLYPLSEASIYVLYLNDGTNKIAAYLKWTSLPVLNYIDLTLKTKGYEK